MKTRLRVTVEGKAFEVMVETLEDITPARNVPANVAAPIAAPVPPPAAPAAPAPARTAAAPGDVTTPLAGTVLEVLMKPGQAVQEDETILILEAMKMKTPIPAPRGGTITEVLVHPGQSVIEGEAIARMA